MRIGITERGDGGIDQSWKRRLHEVDGAIIITKAPQRIEVIQSKTVIHCTVTGWGSTRIEPGVESPTETIQAYQRLVKAYGPERVVLRIDPIFPTNKGIDAAIKVFKKAEGRVRISFIDMYPHVIQRFKEIGLQPPKTEGMHFPLSLRQKVAAQFPGAEICGEPGLSCTGCISQRDLDAMGIEARPSGLTSRQRHACKCIAEKFELLSHRGQCQHRCLYCYWK